MDYKVFKHVIIRLTSRERWTQLTFELVSRNHKDLSKYLNIIIAWFWENYDHTFRDHFYSMFLENVN